MFFRSDDVPIADNVFWPTCGQALNCPKGNIQLAFCENCGCIANLDEARGAVDYGLEYENSLHFSPSFQGYAKGLAADLVGRYGLRGKTVVEIGCGKGEFLAMVCEQGGNRGIGFDPSYANGRGDGAAGLGVTYINQVYSDAGDYACDFICCRHVLEHIASPKAFLSMVRCNAQRTHAAVYFEVPNARYTLEQAGIWDIIYPHRFYFADASLERLFTRCGFSVSGVRERFGGQFLSIEARPDNGAAVDRRALTDDKKSLVSAVDSFARRYESRVEELTRIFAQLRESARRAVVWGAGSKGVAFLNKFKGAVPVGYIVDVNPHKQGKFVPGTGQRVVPPEFLKEFQADYIIILNPNYRQEVERQVEALGIRAEFLQV